MIEFLKRFTAIAKDVESGRGVMPSLVVVDDHQHLDFI